MQFSTILCFATYDWFCADGSHIDDSSLELRFRQFWMEPPPYRLIPLPVAQC